MDFKAGDLTADKAENLYLIIEAHAPNTYKLFCVGSAQTIMYSHYDRDLLRLVA